MLSEDYIIRMINLAISALLEAIGLKKSGDYQTALQVIDLAFEHLLGLRASMAKALDDERLYFLLTREDRLDTRRLAVVADLFHEEGDIYAILGRAEEAAQDYTRALRYDLDVSFNEPEADLEELKQKIESLAQKLDLNTLGADTLWPLAGYYEESGAFARAESTLLILAARPETRAEILPEVVAFYQRLLKKPRADLEQAGLPVEKVKESLRKLETEL